MTWRPRNVSIERTGGPERIYDKDAADPDWKPRPVGFITKAYDASLLTPIYTLITHEPIVPITEDHLIRGEN